MLKMVLVEGTDVLIKASWIRSLVTLTSPVDLKYNCSNHTIFYQMLYHITIAYIITSIHLRP